MAGDTVVLAGGSGFLGRILTRRIRQRGWRVVNLTRSPRTETGGAIDVAWDGRSTGEWVASLDGAAALINLAGRSIDCRHNAENRRRILESRVKAAEALGAAMKRIRRRPPVWIQASAIAYYGSRGEPPCQESEPPGDDYLAEICQRWEAAHTSACPDEVRSVILRIGLVLGRDGGALPRLASLARKGLGGTVGNGRQWVSWVHADDFARLVLWALDRPDSRGVYNATSPNPVRNREFMRRLRGAIGVRFGPPAPAIAVRIGAFLMGTAASLALDGRRCPPARATAEGFRFQYPDLSHALANLLKNE
ncbi:MAG: TIGR01777 family protein [Planctomycetota bacterium]|nr:MAG: TIGR01777 family protein [Planctomycetota bacterium]